MGSTFVFCPSVVIGGSWVLLRRGASLSDERSDQQPLYVPITLLLYWERLLAKTNHLTTAEFGGYVRLLLHQLQKGHVPVTTVNRAAQIMGCTPSTAKQLLVEIQPFFRSGDDGLWRNRRLEEVREDQRLAAERSRENGRKGGRPPKPRTNPDGNLDKTHGLTQKEPRANPEAKPPISDLQSPEPITTRDPVSAVPQSPIPGARATLIPRGIAAKWGERHSDHETGFCDWMCFPTDQARQFATRVNEADPEHGLQQVRAWANHIRASWRGIPAGKMYDFWNARWTETHGESRPATGGVDPLAGIHAIRGKR